MRRLVVTWWKRRPDAADGPVWGWSFLAGEVLSLSLWLGQSMLIADLGDPDEGDEDEVLLN